MNEIITSYFSRHNSIAIDGIGVFSLQRESARLNFSDKKMIAPQYAVVFEENKEAKEDALIRYIVAVEQCSDEEAARRWQSWTDHLRDELERKGEASLPFGGSLQKADNGKISFLPAEYETTLPDAVAERVIRNQSETTTVDAEDEGETEWEDDPFAEPERDRWWVAALIIFLIAVSIIAYSMFAGGLEPKLTPQDAPATFINQ